MPHKIEKNIGKFTWKSGHDTETRKEPFDSCYGTSNECDFAKKNRILKFLPRKSSYLLV